MSDENCPSCGKGCVACFKAGRSYGAEAIDRVLNLVDAWRDGEITGEAAMLGVGLSVMPFRETPA